jgi:hypothetical protein
MRSHMSEVRGGRHHQQFLFLFVTFQPATLDASLALWHKCKRGYTTMFQARAGGLAICLL